MKKSHRTSPFYLFPNILLIVIGNSVFAQTGKVGINTTTPTEILDVKGTLRVRSLPNTGTANSIYTTGTDAHSGATPTQTFTGTTPLMINTNGVLGTTTFSNLVPNNTAPNFNTTNTSGAMLVIKRFTIGDWASGQNGNLGFDTGMSVANWEAILSGWMSTFTNNSTASSASQIFGTPNQFGFRMRAQTGGAATWRIIGDIATVNEAQIVDVLFISKKNVATETRTN
ncbi:hypothetical protein SAMN05421594_4080 [Chryseobacterium oleae]|uniref:Uncharacterized protein n=1 Tax=Chryseobacterium oleae TaxID=491207 RepID=A0A1I5BIC6_CHROL|nr:hypothetical protein [Chryseobacterium oleae]SFN74417.1 hypothetical protein SAMN05421594_4080 [Chryseobacterium oleae]